MKKFLLFLITLFFAASSTWAAVYTVPVPYPTIQSAINATTLPGDIVQVAPGLYPEVLGLDFTGHPGITLQGAGIGWTIIQAVPGGFSPNSSPPCAIWVPENNVTLTGFTLVGLKNFPPSPPPNGIEPRRGIKFQGTTPYNPTVDGSIVNEIEVMDFYRTGLEFFLCNNSTIGFPLSNSVILHDNGGRGLALIVVNGALVQGLTTYNNEWTGMAVQSRTEPQYAPGLMHGHCNYRT